MVHEKLVSHEEALAELAAAEQDAGWMAVCETTGRHLVLTRELADAIAERFRSLGAAPIVEVCAGGGALARSLQHRGVDVIATDIAPQEDSAVNCCDAASALRKYRPKIVIGCFVPVDSNVDAAVLGWPTVDRYLVIAARLNGQLASSALWSAPGWRQTPLADVSRWLVTRHDVWLGRERGILQRGEAWLCQRDRSEA